MALLPRQKRKYLDSFSLYRESLYRDSMGDPTYGAWVYTDQACKLFTTSNFDESTVVASVLAGAQNLLVADRLHYDASLEIRGGDFVKVTTELGKVVWYTVAGFGKERSRFNVGSVFVIISPAPVIDLVP